MLKITQAQKALQIEADRILQAWLVANGAIEVPRGFKACKDIPGWPRPINCPCYRFDSIHGPYEVLPASSMSRLPGYECYSSFVDWQRAREGNLHHKQNYSSGIDFNLTPRQFTNYVSRMVQRFVPSVIEISLT